VSSDPNVSEQHKLYRAMLDAMPMPVFVVDEDVRIIDRNAAAVQLVAEDPEFVLNRLCGSVLRCLHEMETDEGCGHSPPCRECVIRHAVNETLQGQSVSRHRVQMELTRQTELNPVHLLVTAAPFEYDGRALVLLVLEDISELVTLRGIVPICASCKNVRVDEEYWQQVEKYFSTHLGVMFTHGLCPDCAKKFFPEE
jgi:PAS domain-containing protein